MKFSGAGRNINRPPRSFSERVLVSPSSPVESKDSTMSNENKNGGNQNENRQQDNRQSAAEREDRSGVILFELGSESKNTNPHLSSADAGYRGITKKENRSINERMAFENDGIPDLPGFFVEIDIKNRRLNLYDPLTRPEFKRTRDKLEAALGSPAEGVIKRTYSPLKDRVTENCQNDLMVKWLMELYSLVEDDQAQLRKGKFPQAVIDRVESGRRKAAELQWGVQEAMPQLV